MNTVRKFKEDVAGKSSKGIEFLFRKNKVERLVGHGSLAGPGKGSVKGPQGERIVEAKDVVIATGSAPRLLPGVTLGPGATANPRRLAHAGVPQRVVVLR